MKIESLFPYIMPDVPGAPDDLVKQAILLSAIEFCERSLFWNEVQDPIKIYSNVNEIDIEVPAAARVMLVRNVYGGNYELTPLSLHEIADRLPDWQTSKATQPVFYTAFNDLKQIRIYPIPIDPPEAFRLTIRVAFAPTMTSTTVPDALVTRHLEGLMSGAKYRLMLNPGRSWSNADLAAYHKGMFDNAWMTAKIEAEHGGVQGTLRVRPRLFGF